MIFSRTKTPKKIIEQHQTMKLDLDDSEAFVNALLNPAQPNQALKAAALRYKQVMRDGTDNS
ncbi:DUF1778 domain-containing protein [Microcoleus sp. herbarium2]|uniref:DUF1778 domain-containing protein n=1 Tax=Microcoleus sp. herbarium2 TaxID=3055433 RepID=UPI002FCEE9CC